MVRLSKREYIIIGALAACMIFFMIGKHILLRSQKPTIEFYQDQAIEGSNIVETDANEPEQERERFIIVDICGAVQQPGVVKLKEGGRIIDAVEIAGGLLPTADRRQVNLARILEDGEQVYIPEAGEIEYTANVEVQQENLSAQNGKTNINTATQAELEALNGIGKVLAERILQYRNEKGKFKTIDEIKNVSGIGDKKFEGIKDYISVR
ncbi:helix-hairpin-helix domain-containing protein [Geosporobacter ferrireducens]|uniref:Helix-hairpin-helix DNA-binding motif class 1 domain-containing protein n=1 Tax=Geosporobacter ferrireducens TaxID=1424294 RepID=A0A1D8GPF1_9FIRM|nr:helix-hairpin-helix domain-containing protein [Geosporobacter ferrireducens]AOT72783.1 hypothetical protein Gferi_26430 [Geosporobacter ferrireducens]MTI55199.1 competence protein ComEA [Geosporobacter ferrireducens]